MHLSKKNSLKEKSVSSMSTNINIFLRGKKLISVKSMKHRAVDV